MKLKETTTNKGNAAVVLENYKFRKDRTASTGQIVWRCLNKNCKVSIRTDSMYSLLSDPTLKHNHPPNNPDNTKDDNSLSLNETVSHNLTNDSFPNKSSVSFNDSANALSAVSGVFNKTNCSTPINPNSSVNSDLSDQYHDSDAPIESLRKQNLDLIKKMDTLRQQWNDALSHSIDVDKRLMECKTVLDQMRLGSSSKPDKNSVLTVMTQKIRNSELREFIQDSINDCFEAVESEPQYQIGKCDFSKKLALCLEEKGQQNCEDWDEEDEDEGNNKKRGSNSNINRYPNGNNNNNNNNNYNSNPRPNNNPYRG